MRQVDMLVGVSGRRNEKKRGMGRYLFGFSSLALMLGACESGGVVKSLALPDDQAPELASVTFDAGSSGGNALVLRFEDNSNIKLTETDTEKILEKLFIRLKSKDGEGGERVLVSSDIVSIKTVNKQLRIEIDPSKFQYKEGDIFTVDIKPGLVTDDSNNQLEVPSGGLKTEEVVAPDVPPLFVGADAGVLDLASGGTELKWEEGKTRVGDFGARDPNGDVVSYSLGGRDAALFKIDEAGVLSFRSLPALKGDSDGDGVYEVDISAKGGDLTTLHRLTVNVGKDEPILNPNVPTWSSSTENVSVAENETAVSYTAMASDADGDTLTYSLGGADSGKFDINTATGVLTFKNAPDFEATTKSADGNNAYEVTLTANDGKGGLNGLMLTVNVTDVDETIPNNVPSWSGTTETVSVAENETAVVYTTVASDADSDTLMYSVSGDESGLFSIEASTGVLRFKDAPDYENALDAGSDNGYEVTVTVDDGRGGTDTLSLMVNVSDVNESPSWRRSTETVSVDENDVAVVYTSRASDVDAGDTLTYSVSGADSGKFNINTATGVLTFKSGPDFEATTKSADGNNAYEVEVTASDGKGGTDTLALTVNVENVNEATTWNQATEVFTVDENTTAVAYTSRASDVDADALMYSLGGADAGKFNINTATGVLTFKNAPDFEARGSAAGDNGYKVTVTADDGGGSMDTLTLTVNVKDVDETIPNNVPSWSGTTETVSVAENETAVVYTTVASDADSDTLMYSVSGDESGLFSIEASTGVLRFKDAPDYENALDAGSDNGYEVTVTVDDGRGGTDTLSLMVNVTDENESPSWRRSTETVSVDENDVAVVYTSRASDVDAGDTLTYSVSGADSGKFDINTATGVLTFKTPPDYEALTATQKANGLSVTVTADDGNGGESDLMLSVNVTDENEAPVFAAGLATEVTFAEGTGTDVTIFTAMASDEDDGDSVTYSVTGTVFKIDGDGKLSFNVAPDYEALTQDEKTNGLSVTITAEDGGGLTAEHELKVRVTDVVENRAPAFAGGLMTSVSVMENSTGVGTFAASDDDGDTLMYTLSGDDAALFEINGAGVLTFMSAPDYERLSQSQKDNGYKVTVTASDDGGLMDAHALTVNVTNVNDNSPVFSGGLMTSVSVMENSTAVGTFAASDDDGDTLMYSLTGADSGLFSIDANTGVLTFTSGPDYEAMGSAAGNNGYKVTVTAEDGDGLMDALTLTVNVTDVNESPLVFDGNPSSSANVLENTKAVATFMASDTAGSVVMYSVKGEDASFFVINADTGVLSLGLGLDFEMAVDEDGDGIYDVTVVASVEGSADESEHDLMVSVTDDSTEYAFGFDDPGPSSRTVSEGYTGVLGTFHAPVFSSITYSLAGKDAHAFTLESRLGNRELKLKSKIDYEYPTDAGGNNVYEVFVVATSKKFGSDAQVVAWHKFTATVKNAQESLKFKGSLLNTVSVDENTTFVGEFTAHDDGRTRDTEYSLEGDDAGLFSVDTGHKFALGAVTFKSAPDYEDAKDVGGDNTYNVTIKAVVSKGGVTKTVFHDLEVKVANVNDNAPVFSGLLDEVAIDEETTLVGTFAASDLDDDSFMYGVKGADAALFEIDGAGALSFKVAPDYETLSQSRKDNGFSVTIEATTGAGVSAETVEHALMVSVTDTVENRAPVFGAGLMTSVDVMENTTAVGTFVASDPEGGAVMYALSGVDSAFFDIDGAGVLTFKNAPDFEDEKDVGGNNVYDVTITASDVGGLMDDHVLMVNVTDVVENRAPIFSTGLMTSVDVAEDSATLVGTFAASDPDGDAVMYSVGGVDAGFFMVDGNGVLSFKNAPDFEMKQDDGGNNVYDVTVTASDVGGLMDDHVLMVNVTDVVENRAPIFSAGLMTSVSVMEGVTSVGTFAASDPDGDALMYVLSGVDSALFDINGATGVLTFKSDPDFEDAKDVGGNNVYDVTITASDGDGLMDTHALMVSVTNEPWDAVAENYGKKSGYDSKISDLIIVDLGSSGWNPLLVVDDPRSWIKIVSGGSTYTGNAAVDLNFISADKLYIYTDPGILKKGSATLTIKKAALTKSGGVNEPADKVIDFTVGDAINQDGVPAPVFVSLNYDDTLGPSLLSGIHVQFNRALHADIDKSKITVHVEFKTTSGSSFRVDSSQKTYPLAVDMGGDAPYVEGIFLTLPIPLQFLTNPPDFYQSRVRVEFKSGAVKNGAGGNTAVFTDWEVVPTSAPSIEDDVIDLGLSVGDRDDDEGLDLVGLSAYDDFSF